MSGLIPASRAPKGKVERIYTTDPLGILDEELIDEVGWALWSKYDSLFTVSAAHFGSVLCPACGKASTTQGQIWMLLKNILLPGRSKTGCIVQPAAGNCCSSTSSSTLFTTD